MKETANAFYFFLRKTFDIRQGEFHRAILMQLYIFLIISTLLIVKPTVNGLFLSKFGVEKLPYAFMLVAVFAGVVTTLYARLVRNLPLNRIINGTLLFSVGSLLLFGLFLRINVFESIVLYVFYIWVAIFALLTTSQFWILANIVLNAREAKRLFGFIGAGAVAGGIFGGYFTSVIAEYMGSEFLPFWAALFLALCLPINMSIWNKHVDKKQSVIQQKKRLTGIGDHPFNLLRKSRHLTFLASIVGVSVMVAKLVDYQFGGIAAALIPDPDELTSFFGFWLSTFSVISLLLQLFVTRRVVGTFGVGSSLLFLPGTILIAVVALTFFPGLLAAAVFLKMSDAGLKQSINKAAMELLILPIPVNIKNQTKTFIDVFIDSLATGLSGVILIFLVTGLNLSTNAISVMIVGLLMLWFYLISQVREEYLISFRRKIELPNSQSGKKGIDISNESVLNGIKKVLMHGSDYQQLEVLKKIRGITKKQLFEPLRILLFHPSDKIKAEALRHLYYYSKPNLEPEVEFLTQHESQDVQIAAFEYMVKHSRENRVSVMEKYLHQEDYRVRGAALVSLAIETRDNPKLVRQFKLIERLQGKLDVLPSIKNEEELEFRSIIALKTIGYANLSDFYYFIHSSFSNSNLNIANEANVAAGNTLSPEFITPLIQNLSNVKIKSSARDALSHFGHGIIDVFWQMEKSGKLNDLELRHITSVVKRIGSQQSVEFLFYLYEHDNHLVRYQAIRGLNFLRNNNSHLKFHSKNILDHVNFEINHYRSLNAICYAQVQAINETRKSVRADIIEAREGLVKTLEKKIKRSLEQIFRLLGLIHSNDDIYIIYKGLKSNKSDLRTNALEFLDNLINPAIKKTLIPLLEVSMNRSGGHPLKNTMPSDLPEDFQCFQILLNGKDPRVKMNVLFLLKHLNEERYNYLIKEQTKSSQEKVRNFARKVEAAILE